MKPLVVMVSEQIASSFQIFTLVKKSNLMNIIVLGRYAAPALCILVGTQPQHYAYWAVRSPSTTPTGRYAAPALRLLVGALERVATLFMRLDFLLCVEFPVLSPCKSLYLFCSSLMSCPSQDNFLRDHKPFLEDVCTKKMYENIQ